MRNHRFFELLAALAAILALSAQLMASIDRGAIRGTVTDPQGAVVPEAKVVVRNLETGVEARLATNAAGFYLATELIPGKYSIRIEASGFSPLEITAIMVGAGTTVTQDAELKVGATTQRIEVSARTQLVETTSSNFSTSISRRYLENLPLQGRDVQTLVSLFPGVIQSSGPSGAVFGSNSQFGGFPDPLHLVGSSISANGGQAGANAWFLEGALNATVGAEAATVNPSPDAVAEFNLVQNGLAAENGRTSGAVVNVVLKSGTNDLHGSLYAANRNSVFSATNPYARRDAKGDPFLQPWVNWNSLGGTLGGPVYIPGVYNGKNRTFFFVSEEMSFLHQRQNKILTVPTPAEKNGDFTGDPRYAGCGVPGDPGELNCIYDPFTTRWDDNLGWYDRDAFPTLNIALYRPIDPLATYYLDSIPNPNFDDPLSPCDPSYYCNNYLGAVGSSMTTHNMSVKIDHSISDKHRLFATWLFNPSYYYNYRYPWNGATAQTGTGIAGAYPYNTRNQLAVLGLTSTFTPTTVNELRFSFGRQNLIAQSNPESVTHTKEVQERVKDLNFWLYEPLQPVPSIAFWNVDSYFSFGPVAYQNSSLGQQAFTLSDNLTKVWGKHTIKTGITFRRNNLWGSAAAGYNINFDGWYLSNNAYWGSGGSGLAEFLLGTVVQGGGGSAVQYSPWQTNDDWAFFGQDDFRVTKNLTLSFGLRWDIYGWIRERHDMLANFDLSVMNPETPYPGKIVYMGTPGHPDRNLFPANKDSFGPRFGFAWSPGGSRKTVIRGGYGIIFSNSLSAAFGQGNGAFSTIGSSVGVTTPITDSPYAGPAWVLSEGAPSIQLPDLTWNRTHDYQAIGTSEAGFGFIKGSRDPYIQQWSLFLQRELPGNMVVSAGYVGSHGSHLLGDEGRDLNGVRARTYQQERMNINDWIYPVDASLDGAFGDCGQWYLPDDDRVFCSGWYALRPYPQWWSVQPMLSPDGFNKYHAAQLRVEKRYSHGLNFIAAYTYSKNIVSAALGALAANTFGPTVQSRGVGRIAWIPGAAGGGVADFSTHTGAEDFDNRRRYDALSPDDTPHVFNFASTYELPFGKGKHFANMGGWANAVIGGWKLTQNWNFQSGVPMYFTLIDPAGSRYGCDGAYGYLSCQPNLVGDLSAGRSGKTKQERAQQWYNPNALCPPWGCDQALTTAISSGSWPDGTDVDLNAVDAYWQLGNSGLRPPSGRIPGFWNADLSLAKDFHLSETKYLNFRWDVFNAFNHQNLGVPDNHWCLPPGPNGEIDKVRRFGCSFGQITNVQTDPRAMQFSLKFVW